MTSQQKKIPFKKALGWILLSTLIFSGSVILGYLYFQHVKENHANNDAFNIIAIIQASSHHEALNTAYLAELLDLSIDKPTNLYKFNSKEAKRKLLSSPFIEQVELKKVRPGTLYINYEMRHPVAFLSDYTNTAIDSKGVLLPFSPFFTPKVLPEIYLGISLNLEKTAEGNGENVNQSQMDLALNCLQYLSQYCCPPNVMIKRIDVSQAFAPSYGLRQIVITMEETVEQKQNNKNVLHILPRILRLSTKEYKQGLANYSMLREHLVKEDRLPSETSVVKAVPLFIDLRLPHLAYYSGEI